MRVEQRASAKRTSANNIGYACKISPAISLISVKCASIKVVPKVTMPRITASELIPARNVEVRIMASVAVLHSITIRQAAESIQIIMISRVSIGLPISKPGRSWGKAARITIATVASRNNPTESVAPA